MSGKSGSVVDDGGAAEDDRRIPRRTARRDCVRGVADYGQKAGERGFGGGADDPDSRPAAGPDVCLRASGYRCGHSRPVDSAGDSRAGRARRAPEGEFIPLAEQDPANWDSKMIDQAEALLRRASTLGSIGRYQLEGALQSAHVHRCRTGENNWTEVVRLYDALFELSGSPVVAINRALAIAEVDGAKPGLAAMPQVESDARLAEYQPYWAARAELLSRTGERDEARQAYE